MMDVIGKDILGMLIILACMVIIAYLKVRPFKEKKSKEPEKIVRATVFSKEVKQGAFDTGRSNHGCSYVIHFVTENGQKLELYAYEIEFGGLRKGMQGILTHQGRYFVNFEEE